MTDTTGTNQTTVSVRGRITGVEVTVTFQIAGDELKKRLAEVLEQLTELGVEAADVEQEDDDRHEDRSHERHERENGSTTDPIARIARELSVDTAEVRKVLGIKGETIDLYRPGRLPVADALSAICYVYEKGLGKNGMSYETFRGLVESHQIKMKTPLPTVCFNLIRTGRIERRAYDDGKLILLTPDGERKAMATLTGLMTGNTRERRAESTKKAPRAKAKGKRGTR